ncbi:zinc finger protein [Macleaya cordata]|uniref:Zinc finger protein n=1 Tax=Macleaya cordata TaxID=56857 RepID=A0A200QE12_MACCD|nr:zinc finger protein [Macleaya cordata]
MEITESIQDIRLQDPPEEEFSSADLSWTKFGTSEHHDDVALIPYDRVDAFIIGECSIVECPTRFHIEKGRKRTEGSLKSYKSDEYLEYRLYWCSFGPENYGEGGEILPSRRYRLNTRNRAARPQSMRGCTCHFIVKRLYARPSIALIIYNDRRQHVNKSGFVCHGPLDRDAIGPGAKTIPYICDEIQQQTMSLIYLGIPEENVLQKHIEGVQRYCGSNSKASMSASQYVHKMGMIIKRSTHELDLDDQASIRLWVERNKKSVFVYQDTSDTDSFILGIQTEWQVQQMIRFGHQSLMAADSTFGIKKLKYPLCTLLVFDSRQHALPVAWVITRSFAKQDVSKWMKALVDRARTVDSSWKISGFLIDDAAAEVDPIRHDYFDLYTCIDFIIDWCFRDIFCCPVLFCLWRVRRSWLRNIVKRCHNIEVQREIFKRLGRIVYGIWGGVDSIDSMEEFIQDFVDQTSFMQYFKACWVPKIEMWLATMKTLPLASQEACGAIEAYHLKLKLRLYDDSHLGSLQRVDWLVHKLTTELHSSYWLDRYADESDSFQNVKEEYVASTSWHRALQIPDDAVILDDKDRLFAKVLSQKDSSQTHIVWNPGSEFSLCDCSWSMQGNLCKHVIKVNMVCDNRQDYQSSMSFQSFREIILSLWRKPMDDSVALDQSLAWTNQMLDQIQRLVELHNANGISSIVNNLPLKWNAKKGRTFTGRPSSILALPPHLKSSSRNPVVKRIRKRKRVARLR